MCVMLQYYYNVNSDDVEGSVSSEDVLPRLLNLN